MSILQRGKLSPKEREIMYLSSSVLSSHGQNFTLGILGRTDRARPPCITAASPGPLVTKLISGPCNESVPFWLGLYRGEKGA